MKILTPEEFINSRGMTKLSLVELVEGGGGIGAADLTTLLSDYAQHCHEANQIKKMSNHKELKETIAYNRLQATLGKPEADTCFWFALQGVKWAVGYNLENGKVKKIQ